MLDEILSGAIRPLARAATLIENRAPGCEELLERLFPLSGRALIAGITGAPGAGKSTLADQLVADYRAHGKRVAVLAVDPSSPFSGGAILGDRIRMNRHTGDTGVFIRSMASRGRLGGLAPMTADVALLLDAAGFDVVLIETLGVGQDEVDVARIANVTAVVMVPGMGDDVQALKAGIIEIANIFVINKSDLPGADRLERELIAAMQLSESPAVPIVRCIASEGKGVAEAAAAMEQAANGPAPAQGWPERLREMLRERLMERISGAEIEAAAEQVAVRRANPYRIVSDWVERLSH